MKRVIWLVWSFSTLTSAVAVAGVDLRFDPAVPVVGQEVRVELASEDFAAARVFVEYGPGSELADRQDVGRLDASGAVSWIAERPGLVRLSIVDEATGETLAKRDLGVRYRRAPMAGLVVLVLAVGILGSGILVGLRDPRG